MKHLKFISNYLGLLFVLLFSLSIISCSSKPKSGDELIKPNDELIEIMKRRDSIQKHHNLTLHTVKKRRDAKVLVLYYSQFGATQKLAVGVKGCISCDIEQIDVENPYNGTYEETIERCKNEKEISKLRPLKSVIANYDVIILCYPIWFGTYAPPIEALIAEEDFEGKEIVPFCTFGSGGLESSVADLRKKLPKAKIHDGYGVRNARIDKARTEYPRYLVLLDLLEGSVFEDEVPYSEPELVTEEDVRIFNEACGDYPYPIGTPIKVGKRDYAGSIDYLFHAESKDKNGNPTKALVYISLRKKEGAKAEFTKVVR